MEPVTVNFETKVKGQKEDMAEMAKLEEEEIDKVNSEQGEEVERAEEEDVVGEENKVVMEKEAKEEVTEEDVVDYDFLKLRIRHKMHGGGKVVKHFLFMSSL